MSALIGGSTVSGLLESVVLVLIAQIAAALVNGKTSVSSDLGPVNVHATVGAMLTIAAVAAAIRLGLQVFIAYLPARIGADFEARTRTELFAGFTEASWGTQAEEREGHLQELMTHQIGQATNGVLDAVGFLGAFFTLGALLVSALFLSAVVALIVLATVALLALALRPLGGLGQRSASQLSRAELEYAGGVSEAVRLAEETSVFGTSARQRAVIETSNQQTRHLFFRTRFLSHFVLATYQSIAILLIILGLAGLYWSGSGRIATLGAVILLLVRSAMYAQGAQGAYHSVLQSEPYLAGLRAVQDQYRANRPVSGNLPFPTPERLSFDRVGFEYHAGLPVLSDVTFDVTRGEVIGIVGPSGAGKSTLVQLLLRLREPSRGRFVINGGDAWAIALEEWNRRVAYVPQEPRLIHDTVAENIRYLRTIDEASVVRAAQLAHIHDDISGWPGGYDTVIGQRADAVSGGQRQRICLARALADQPEILVLDEPTSALDMQSESLVQTSLAALRGELTLFIVAHRLSTLSICDRVMVIVDGKLETFGPTSEVERTNAFYRAASTLTAGTGTDTRGSA
jgi:ATP-binding cassette, subfamily B, bacterial